MEQIQLLPFSPILDMKTLGMCSDVTDDATAPKAWKAI